VGNAATTSLNRPRSGHFCSLPKVCAVRKLLKSRANFPSKWYRLTCHIVCPGCGLNTQTSESIDIGLDLSAPKKAKWHATYPESLRTSVATLWLSWALLGSASLTARRPAACRHTCPAAGLVSTTTCCRTGSEAGSPPTGGLCRCAEGLRQRFCAPHACRPLWRDRVNTLRAATRSCTRRRITRQPTPARETQIRIVKPCRPSAATDPHSSPPRSYGRGEARILAVLVGNESDQGFVGRARLLRRRDGVI
jgi:hypothetical protein